MQREVEKALKDIPEASSEGASQLDMAEMRRIMTSRSFRILVCGMAGLGVAFNVGLAYLCWRFAGGRSEGLLAFLILMAGFALYVHLLPRLFSSESPMGSTFAAAWGVGNMGLSAIIFTRYWLWGPILAVVGTRGMRKP